jgi:hypothetical protein
MLIISEDVVFMRAFEARNPLDKRVCTCSHLCLLMKHHYQSSKKNFYTILLNSLRKRLIILFSSLEM